MSNVPGNIHLVVVCTGNICRSPMGEVIIRDVLEQRGLSDDVTVSSCGTGGWHVGQRPDDRALEELKSHGLDGSTLRASKFDPLADTADMYLTMVQEHSDYLLEHGVPRERIRLLRSFDPDAEADAPVADPYYGDRDGFGRVFSQIEAATEGLLRWVADEIADRSER